MAPACGRHRPMAEPIGPGHAPVTPGRYRVGMSSDRRVPSLLSSPRSRHACAALATAVLVLTGCFALLAPAKPLAAVQLLDLAGEGALALLAAAWFVVVQDSRPGGRVTRWLGAGLAALALAAWADALDELFRATAGPPWLGALESLLLPAGIAALSVGLVLWRQEQWVLGEQLGAREQGQRDHRRFDRLTRLADAAYLRAQMAAEAGHGAPFQVAMFEIGPMLAVQHRLGERAAARLLQSAAQQLLLNLRPGDLVCRYAGDRLVVLMPQTGSDDGQRRVDHLRRMLMAMQVHVAGQAGALPITVACACAPGSADVQGTLSALGRSVDPVADLAPVA